MLWGFKQEGDFKAQVSTDNCGLIFGMNEYVFLFFVI